MTYPNAQTVTLSTPLDGRQTGGRKGFAYDWRSVLLEGGDVAVTAEAGVSFAIMTASTGLLLR